MDLAPPPIWCIGAEGEVKSAIVYIEFGKGDIPPFQANKESAVLELKGCQFEPHVLCVRTDQPINLYNRDPADTYVVASVGPRRANSVGIVMSPGRNAPHVIQPFRAEEKFVLGCLHQPWMSMRICVFAHPFFCVTKADGSFAITEKLPDGQYTFVVWHESGQTIKKTAVIKDGKANLDFIIVPASIKDIAGAQNTQPPVLQFVK